MLLSLHVENLALIKNTTIEFDKGFNVLNGETGAGKSLIMKALKLLIGSKASKDDIRHGEESALSQGCFVINDSFTKEKLLEHDISPDEDDCVFISRKIISKSSSGSCICSVLNPLCPPL